MGLGAENTVGPQMTGSQHWNMMESSRITSVFTPLPGLSASPSQGL